MKKIISILLLILSMSLVSCKIVINVPDKPTIETPNTGEKPNTGTPLIPIEPSVPVEIYTDILTLDRNLTGLTYENDGISIVKLKKVINGDVAYFLTENNTICLRFAFIDAPELHNLNEKWAKEAFDLVTNKLCNASSIVIESNSDKPETDMVGRDLAFVWYKSTEDSMYRNLCLELVEEGLATYSEFNGCKYSLHFKNALEKAEEANKGYLTV